MKYKCIKNYKNYKINDIVEVERTTDGYKLNNEIIPKSKFKQHFEKISLKGFKYTPYSHSKMELWNQCPKKFYYQYVSDLDLEKVASPILEKGTLFHAILECDMKNKLHNINFEQPFEALNQENLEEIVNKALNFISNSKIYKEIKSIKGLRLIEQEFFLGKNLEPVLEIEKALIRGFIDLLIFDEENDKCYIFDWKTGGKSKETLIKYPKPKNQLELYSIWAFQIFTEVMEIEASFVYVEHNHKATYKFKRNDLPYLKQKFLNNIKKIENDEKFKKNISILCAWCDFRNECLGLDLERDPRTITEQEIIQQAQKQKLKKPKNDLLAKKLEKLRKDLK